MELIALPAFTDNYIWMLHNGRDAIVVDPGDASVTLQALDARNLQLTGILVTHRHADHTAGISTLHTRFPQAPIYGPRHEQIDGLTHRVSEGDVFHALELSWCVWDTPGHTAGHITYVAPQQGGLPCPQGLVFCGDTLFSAGCGRLYDGTAGQLAQSLLRLSALPPQTWLCPTHEYTMSNLKFAAAVEPDNTDIQSLQAQCVQWLASRQPSLPTTVARELRINPFLRTQHPQVQMQALAHGAADRSHNAVFTALRTWKDHFAS